MSKKAAWIGDSASQQIQEQSAKYGGGAEMSGYAALTLPTVTDSLPQGWAISTILEAIGSNGLIVDGDWVESKDQDPNGDVRLIQLADIGDGDFRNKSERFMTFENAVRMNCSFLELGDVLIARMPDPLGRACIFPGVGQKAVTVVDVCLIRVTVGSALQSKLLMYWINNPQIRNYIALQATGTTRKRITRKKLEALEFPIPPIAEQQQIAAKLDELLAQVDSIKTRLDAIPKILKRFRQSVLAAATSGALTENWRKNMGIIESWDNIKLNDIADIQGGVTKDSKKQSLADEEVPYLRVANVQRGFLDLSEIKTIRVPANKLETMLLQQGDILFNEGGDIDKLGRGWIWEGQIERCSFQNHVFRARLFDQSNEAKYISWWGNYRGLEYFLRSGKQTTNLASINKTMLSNLPISLPSPEEQTEIVNRVEQLFTYADQIEQRVKDAQARVNHLTQAILAKAFRGELTADWRAQNPELISGENSAEALLKRIKAEWESGKSGKKSKTSL